MNNEEAIKNIVAYMYYAVDDIPEEVGKAFDKAVEALKTERPQGEFTLNDLKEYLLFYGYSSDAVEDTLINFESYVKGKKGGAE